MISMKLARLVWVPFMCISQYSEIAKNPIYHTNAKHVDIDYHFTREQINLGIM